MKLFFSITLYLVSLFAQAQTTADDILGVWWNPEKTSRTEVVKKNGKYYGKLIWVKADEGKKEKSRDVKNENKSLRERTILGLPVILDLEWDEDDKEWQNGTIYDPRRGKEFSFYGVLNEDGTLSLYVYVLGMPFLNKEIVCSKFSTDY